MIDNENRRDETIAKALGITVADLTTMTGSGKTIEQIASEKGITMDTLKKAIDQVKPEPVVAPVKKGIIQKIKGIFKKKPVTAVQTTTTTTVR